MIKINWTEQFIKQQTECLDMLTELIEYDKQHGNPPEKARVLEGFIDTQRRALDMAATLLQKHKPALEEAEKAEREKRQAQEKSKQQSARKKVKTQVKEDLKKPQARKAACSALLVMKRINLMKKPKRRNRKFMRTAKPMTATALKKMTMTRIKDGVAK